MEVLVDLIYLVLLDANREIWSGPDQQKRSRPMRLRNISTCIDLRDTNAS